MVRFDFGPFFQGQMRVAKIKSTYNLLIRVPRGLQCHWFSDVLHLVTFVSFIKQTFCLLSVSTSCSHKHLGPLPTGVYLCQR